VKPHPQPLPKHGEGRKIKTITRGRYLSNGRAEARPYIQETVL
jgi:hypothetical protein